MKKFWLTLLVCALFVLGATPAFAAVDPSDITLHTQLVNNGGIVTDELNPTPAGGATAQDIQVQANLPAKYDLRDVDGKNYIAPVKFQNPWGNCWAFATMCSLESSAMKNGATDVNLSEKALTWYAMSLQGGAGTAEDMKEGIHITSIIGLDDSNHYKSGGTYNIATAQLATWNGSSTTEQVPFQNASGKTQTGTIAGKEVTYYAPDGTWGLDDSHLYDQAYHLQNAQSISTEIADIAAAKQALMNNGSLFTSFCVADSGSPYYNSTTHAMYTDTATDPTHGVSIVGWDDNYSKTNFNEGHQPENDGAWIVKNSWSDVWGDNGYFYLSYEDKTISQLATFSADMKETNASGQYDYTHNYQYDYLGSKSVTTADINPKIVDKAAENDQILKMANIFTADGNQTLKAVSAQSLVNIGATVTTDIYKITDGENPESGTLVESQTDSLASQEYKTIVLKTPIDLKKGERFSVVQTQKLEIDGQTAYGLAVEMGAQDGTLHQDLAADKKTVADKYTTTDVATVAAGQSFVYGIGASGSTDTWHDLADGSFTGRYMTFAYTNNNEDGTTTNTVAYPGNVMIKAFTTDAPSVTYEVHGRNYGWSQGWKTDGETAGTTGQALRLEALQAKIEDQNGIAVDGLGISYQVHVQNKGWMDAAADGATAGTTGQGLRIEAVKIKLTGDKADQYNVTYRVHVRNQGWTDWASNGAEAGTTGQGLRIEAIEIQLTAK